MGPKIKSVMTPDASEDDDEYLLKDLQKYKIAAYQTWGNEAFEDGDFETAEELYKRAIDEIEVYRENISEIRDQAALDQEDRRNLEALEEELDNLEQGIEEQLDALQ